MMTNRLRAGFLAAAGLSGWLLFSGQANAGDFALSFDGVNDYVQVPDSPSLGFGTGDFSAELWLKTPGPPQYIMDFFVKISDDGNSGWGMVMEPSSGKINFWTNNGDTTTGSGYNDNQWHQIVGAREGDQLKLYADGVLQSSATEDPISNVNIEGSLYIGGLPIFDAYLPGIIDEVRMYNRALAADEVSEHYQGVFSYELKANGKWHFGEGSGTAVADTSGNGNDGTIFGASWVDGYVFPPRVVVSGAPGYFKEGFPPEIKVITPQPGDAFSDVVAIAYSVIDPNDITGPPEFGLSKEAVSLHYSVDAGATWTLITQNLSPVGRFAWNISNLAEGDFYSLKIVAQDKSGQGDEEIVGPITIDRAPPAFDVTAEPAFSKGENVSITVKATEALAEAPTVFVTQRYFQDRRLQVIGRNNIWKGEYEIREGFDGTAEIRVVGRDIAGNSGDIIRSGGFFNIGLNPPPTPIIITPLDGDVVYDPVMSIKGSVRKDAKAVLFVDNQRAREAEPDGEGNFEMQNIELSKTRDNGLNIFQIRAEDKGGNLSEAALLRLTYNVLPSLAILRPRASEVLQGWSLIEFSAADENAASLTFSVETSADSGQTWGVLVSSLKQTSYSWDTRNFPEGEYILRVTVDDGVDKVSAVSSRFSVKNQRPSVSFASAKIVSGTGSAVIEDGAARSLSRSIVDVEYSLDNGVVWLEAASQDGAFDSPEEAFRFQVSGLKEGVYEILVRTRDSGGFGSEAAKTLIVDFGPPPAPALSSPKAGAVFGFLDDLNDTAAGTQILVTGKAEPNNQIVIANGEMVFEGASDALGSFRVEVALRQHGNNALSVHSVDPAGNRSLGIAQVLVVHNNPPDVRFLRPKAGGAIGGEYEIVFEIQDRDLDPIQGSSLYYRHLPGRTKVLLAENMDTGSFIWDASSFAQGFYELILEAADGVSDNSITLEFLIDNTPPQVSFEPLEQSLSRQAFTLRMQGAASDDFSGIHSIDYTIDYTIIQPAKSQPTRSDLVGSGGERWFRAVVGTGYGERQATWQFTHPEELGDGAYEVRVRSVDFAGNVSAISQAQKIVVDSTPPRIGSFALSIGSLALLPEENVFQIPLGIQTAFVISLEGDTESATLFVGERQVKLARETGLWKAVISAAELGEQKVSLSAQDAAGNETLGREIMVIEVVPKGKVVSAQDNASLGGARLEVQVFLVQDQSWARWQAEAYGLSNPVVSGGQGEYQLFLPEGIYRIVIQKTGFQRLKSSVFELKNPYFATFDFSLQKRQGLRGFLENIFEFFTL